MVKRRKSALNSREKSHVKKIFKKKIWPKLVDENEENSLDEKKDNSINLSSQSINEKMLWTLADVCLLTSYKRGTIYNLVSNGSIPHRKCGKKLFFIPSEILSWVKGE